MLEKLKQKIEHVRDIAEAKTAAMLPDDWKVPEHVAKERFAICTACEHLYKPTHSCKLCGCFMGLKTTLARAECPKNKWTTYTADEK